MNEQTQKMLQQLADRLGVTVQYLWAALIKGNRIEGAILFGFVTLGLIAGVVSYLFFCAGFKDKGYDTDLCWIGGWVTGIIATILVLGCSYWAIMDTVCPEYGALTDILAHLK